MFAQLLAPPSPSCFPGEREGWRERGRDGGRKGGMCVCMSPMACVCVCLPAGCHQKPRVRVCMYVCMCMYVCVGGVCMFS